MGGIRRRPRPDRPVVSLGRCTRSPPRPSRGRAPWAKRAGRPTGRAWRGSTPSGAGSTSWSRPRTARRRRWSSPPSSRSPPSAPTAAAGTAGRPTTSSSTPPPTAASWRSRRAGGPVRVLSREGRAAAPTVAPGGDRVASRPGARRRVRRRGRAARRLRLAPARLARRLRLGPRVVARRRRARVARVGPAEHAVGRFAHRGRAPATPRPRVVAGGDSIAVGQPRFSPVDDSLAYVSDERGWMNVWLAPADGTPAQPVLEEPREHAEPSWGPGQRSFTWSPSGTAIALNRNEDGFGRLVVVPVEGSNGGDVSRGWHAGLDWGSEGIACVRSGGRTAPQLTVLSPDTGDRRVLARGAPGELDAVDLPEPRPVTWPGRRRRDRPRSPVAASRHRPRS